MPDTDALEEMRALVEDLADAAEALRELGEREELPAVERNAARLEGVIEQLDRNLPPELVDD